MAQEPAEASRRLLLVDDDEALLRHMSVAMGRLLACPIDQFNDGNRAIASAKVVSYAAAVLDLDMPELDGLALCQQMRRVRDDLPFILLTGQGTPGVDERARAAGFTACIMKPIQADDLVNRLRDLRTNAPTG